MKIKTVCELTGLTDRAVRFYIDEGLLSPDYSENYLGRRSFSFTDKDVAALREIAVLRKYGFTVAQIKEMYGHPESIGIIVSEARAGKETDVKKELELLRSLDIPDDQLPDSVSCLVSALSKPAEHAPIPATDKQSVRSKLTGALRPAAYIIAVGTPIIFSLIVFLIRIRKYAYPVFNIKITVLAVISLIPSFLLITPFAHRSKKAVKTVLTVLCIISLVISPILTFFTVTRSETTDIKNYLKLDTDCPANKSDLFRDVFPAWPHYFENVSDGDSFKTVYLDSKYMYRTLPAMDYTYDIYAEWPLDESEFYKEVDRVKRVFESHAPKNEAGITHYATMQKGKYTCLINYLVYNGSDKPFEPAADNYTYCIFAYDEQEYRVRYIYCDSMENGVDQPYYLELNWD